MARACIPLLNRCLVLAIFLQKLLDIDDRQLARPEKATQAQVKMVDVVDPRYARALTRRCNLVRPDRPSSRDKEKLSAALQREHIAAERTPTPGPIARILHGYPGTIGG